MDEIDSSILQERIELLQDEIANLREAARALYAALEQREYCEVCGVGGTEIAIGTVLDDDGHEVQCQCSTNAERTLEQYSELAKGEGTDVSPAA